MIHIRELVCSQEKKMDKDTKKELFVASSILFIIFIALGIVSKDLGISMAVVVIILIGLLIVFGIMALADIIFR